MKTRNFPFVLPVVRCSVFDKIYKLYPSKVSVSPR